MTEGDLINFLKENLRIELSEYKDRYESFCNKGIEVKLFIGNEEISSDRIQTESY